MSFFALSHAGLTSLVKLINSRVLLPGRNRKDVQSDLPESVRSRLTIAFISSIEEALEEIWGREVWTCEISALRRVKAEARL